MKHAVLLAIVAVFAAAPLLAQTAEQAPEATAEAAEQAAQPTASNDVEELRSVARLPEAVKEARDAGSEEEEITNVVKGMQEKRLSSDEGVNTIQIMRQNTDQGVSNKGISEFVAEQKAKGVRGEELGKAVKAELQARHRVRVEEGKGATERKEERTGEAEETPQPAQRGAGKGAKGQGQPGTQTPEEETTEQPTEQPTEKPVEKTTK